VAVSPHTARSISIAGTARQTRSTAGRVPLRIRTRRQNRHGRIGLKEQQAAIPIDAKIDAAIVKAHLRDRILNIRNGLRATKTQIAVVSIGSY
jgi:hypothetical protein